MLGPHYALHIEAQKTVIRLKKLNSDECQCKTKGRKYSPQVDTLEYSVQPLNFANILVTFQTYESSEIFF